ncbi:MAG TPA: hypothetical protein VNA04_10790 [Thermoanaerobaculia bacterium]|nr:hypothetical protein [Thermoanaerobaculia bacterium]
MNKPLLALTLTIACTAAAQAQTQIRTTPGVIPASDRGGFRIGPRYSNYSTDIDVGILTVESVRQHAFGLAGEYRSGVFVLDFNFDHDPENGLQITALLPIEIGRYERDRGELTVGWSALPVLDIQAGFRFDSFSVGAGGFGGSFFAGEDFDHSAIVVGIRAHTPTRSPFGLYGVLRGFAGSVDFGVSGLSAQVDSSGWRAEGGVEIPIGQSRWHAVPGIELERLDADPRVRVETNRFFVNFMYTFP